MTAKKHEVPEELLAKLLADYKKPEDRELQAVALTLNNRPRKTLGWKTPAEVFNEYLESVT